MVFRHLYDGKRVRVISCPGERYQIEYREIIAPDGTPTLEAVGKIDLVALHEKDRDSVDLPAIVARYQSGDITALDQGSKPLYYDATAMPDDPVLLAQSLNIMRAKYGDLGKAISDLESKMADERDGLDDDASNSTVSSGEEAVKVESK